MPFVSLCSSHPLRKRKIRKMKSNIAQTVARPKRLLLLTALVLVAAVAVG
jgi:hypothetical protein